MEKTYIKDLMISDSRQFAERRLPLVQASNGIPSSPDSEKRAPYTTFQPQCLCLYNYTHIIYIFIYLFILVDAGAFLSMFSFAQWAGCSVNGCCGCLDDVLRSDVMPALPLQLAR